MSIVDLAEISVPFNDDSMRVTAVQWSDNDTTRITLLSKRSGRMCFVTFESVVGLRILDELYIASMWLNSSRESRKASWLFEVRSNGWFALESTRDDFYLKHESTGAIEYLVAGLSECVSILSSHRPMVAEIDMSKDA